MSDEREMKQGKSANDEREQKAGHGANPDELADVEAHKKSHLAADGTAGDGDDVEAHMKQHKL